MTNIRLPPLNAVRAFVAAARHASITLAATELGVTHGAVSRQIKLLEEHLGAQLFVRETRQIVLTPVGRQLFAGFAPALERIAATAATVARLSSVSSLRINVRASFAARWLIPQLPSFIRKYPHVAPQIFTGAEAPARLSRDSFDVIIRRTKTGWPSDLKPRPFMADQAYLVAAPSLLDARPVESIDDLTGHVFLHSETRANDWREWLRFAGGEGIHPADEMRFDHLDFALRAAADGLGIAVGPASLVAQDIESKRLCHVLPTLTRPLDPYLIAASDESNPAARVFEQWLLNDVERES
ncbi:LysR substrate-binding domain-containing protein [Bradyrhizobium liaoningense]|uniref:LysR substrate-binding domain-containing protein n=1 Tax=Bradyrhizobium liaoningense TaxID=43992 RepID=UPI001BA4B126|nr:LysR substrate-binding domain-containing protein [Bradyrhizobium liaoningense]MBR0713773.1 LysR family transcriptional regulator [Bradyrhizobium liaoningense]